MDISDVSKNDNLKVSKAEKKTKSDRVRVAVLVFVILIFIVSSLILTDSIVTKYETYKAYGNLTGTVQDAQGEKAGNRGNLGNFNIVSKNNTIADNKDGTYTLRCEFEFTNYGTEGRSFNDGVDVFAYQNDKEIKPQSYAAEFTIGDTEDEQADDGANATEDESDLKVRNSKSSTVILNYILKDPSQNVNVDMTSGDYSFTYTVNLKDSAKTAESTTQNSEAAQESTTGEEESKN